MIATIVDWAALGKVVLYSFAGVLLTGLFTTGVLFIEVDGRRAPASRRALAICRGANDELERAAKQGNPAAWLAPSVGWIPAPIPARGSGR
jgi:hypothetical protein